MTSYQRRKRKIAYLEQRIQELIDRVNFFQKAIWSAREATGERRPVSPFCDLEGNEESLDMALDPQCYGEDLLKILRKLPLTYPHPGVKGSDYT